MLKESLAAILLGSIALSPAAGQQQPRQAETARVVTTDIDAFWAAYDSARATPDSAAQVRIVRELYIGRGSPGVAAFMAAKGYTAEQWAAAIRRYPAFWASIRPATYRAKSGAEGLEPHLARLRALYPELRPAKIYFTVGALASSGTTQDSTVLIGAELVTGTPETDISEFPPAMQTFLARYFGTRPFANVIPLTVHEYVHTQQRGTGRTVLARALREGSADWVAELVTGTRLPLPYMTYGPAHEAELKARFRAEMLTPLIRNWFYNQISDDPAHVSDLGYYMGYAISRAYYERAADKHRALREMIELDFDDDGAAEDFLRRSGYYPGALDRAALLRAYESRRPVVTRVVPSGATGGIDAGTTEIRVEFSTAMAAYTGVGFGPGGQAQWPVTGRTGWSPDRRAYTFQVKLEPGRTYGFVLEGSADGGFRSLEGYPLQPYTVEFTTRGARP